MAYLSFMNAPCRGKSTRTRTCVKQNPVTFGSDYRGPSERVALCDTETCPSYSTSQVCVRNVTEALDIQEDRYH